MLIKKYLVERGCVIDQAHCPDTEYSFQVLGNRRLQLLEAVKVGKAKDVEDQVFLEAAQTHISSVDIPG